MRAIRGLLKGLARSEEGATMIEYALMASLIAVLCVATVTTIGTSVQAKYEKMEQLME